MNNFLLRQDQEVKRAHVNAILLAAAGSDNQITRTFKSTLSGGTSSSDMFQGLRRL